MSKKTSILIACLVVALAVAVGLLTLSDDDMGTSRIKRIGVLNYVPAGEPALKGLREGLKAQGWAEGTDYEMVYAGVIRDKAKLKTEAERLIKLGVDMLYTISTPATLAAKSATSRGETPVVFGPVNSPVKVGIVKSLKRPGGNITGVTFGPQEPRRLEMLLKIKPGVKKIYVPYNPMDKSPRVGLDKLKLAAEKLNLQLHVTPIRNEQELTAALDQFPPGIDVIYLPTDSMMVSFTPLFVEFSRQRKLPLSTTHREGVRQGALYSYGFSIFDVGHQAARLVVQVMKGVLPNELPIELADFKLIVNRETAQIIGLEIPANILRHADIVPND